MDERNQVDCEEGATQQITFRAQRATFSEAQASFKDMYGSNRGSRGWGSHDHCSSLSVERHFEIEEVRLAPVRHRTRAAYVG